MLGWVQKVLPQPPATPQKTKMEREERAEPEPQLELETGREPEREPEAAPEEAELGDESLVRETQEAAPTLPTSLQAQVAVVPEANSPSGQVLTWLRKGMEKVVPQPVYSGRPAQNTAAGLEGPAQQAVRTVWQQASSGSSVDHWPLCRPRPWLLRWFAQNLDRVLPQPPKTSEVTTSSSTSCSPCGLAPPEPPLETEPVLQAPESPSLPPTRTRVSPRPSSTPKLRQTISPGDLPPGHDPFSPTCRLMTWLLHRLEMALPQPVLHGKAGEQVGAAIGQQGPGWWEEGVSGAQARVGWSACVPGVGAQEEEGSLQQEPSPPACLSSSSHSFHTLSGH
uniref:Uncharacterized protein n=1 Tax=Equus asinus asinus TaxID=83772 RepID=A0A8C4LEE6_EQUAS